MASIYVLLYISMFCSIVVTKWTYGAIYEHICWESKLIIPKRGAQFHNAGDTINRLICLYVCCIPITWWCLVGPLFFFSGWCKVHPKRWCIQSGTAVSVYNPPGYKPTSVSVPLKEFQDCFCYPLHSKVSIFGPTGCKHKQASVLPNCPPKHAIIRL